MDLAFWLIIFSIIGARIYHIILQFSYYLQNPLQVFMIWNGGIAIHGAIIAGLLTIYYFSRKYKLSFLKISAIIAPSLALAQAIGRWGNYFNQELFGKPTSLPWGIPISSVSLPADFVGNLYFHPTFLYESLGNLLIFAILILIIFFIKKKDRLKLEYIPFIYLMLYSSLRIATEFIRIDQTPVIFGFRFPQLISTIIIILSVYFLYRETKRAPIEKN